MSSPQDQLDQIHQDKLKWLKRKRAGLVAAILLAASTAVWGVQHHYERGATCAQIAHDEMKAWMAGKTINDLHYTFNDLRVMYNGHFNDCMER